MQKVAAYLLERKDGMELPHARALEAKRLESEITKWLLSKGASTINHRGTYRPEDGSAGTFSVDEALDGDRSWWMLQLKEETKEGRLFSVALSITNCRSMVCVYATLEAGWTTTQIMPVSLDPRCPRIIRSLLDLPGRWYHGSSTLRRLRNVAGFEAGETLADEIQHADRNVPFVVISSEKGEVLLPELHSKVAYDLAGLANVLVIDEDAAWALTDKLGPPFSCYWSSVRLYWPQFSANADRFFHPLWTAERLRSAGYEPLETRERLRKQLRALVFRAAALSVIRPREGDEIRDAVSRRALLELGQRASSLADYKELADSYAGDNDQLRSERTQLREHLTQLETQVARLEADKGALLAHLRATKAGPVAADSSETPDSMPPGSAEDEPASAPPTAGEVRFYKKVYSRPTHDVLVSVADCGCNNWENAHAADKARKGIAKRENDRSDWKTLQHCASCTGGGMWRVRW